jgi:hypothetical protein
MLETLSSPGGQGAFFAGNNQDGDRMNEARNIAYSRLLVNSIPLPETMRKRLDGKFPYFGGGGLCVSKGAVAPARTGTGGSAAGGPGRRLLKRG